MSLDSNVTVSVATLSELISYDPVTFTEIPLALNLAVLHPDFPDPGFLAAQHRAHPGPHRRQQCVIGYHHLWVRHFSQHAP